MPCTVGFVNYFLRDPLACLGRKAPGWYTSGTLRKRFTKPTVRGILSLTCSILLPLQLFVSKRSVFDGKKAIRGGVPFVFPIFGPSSVMPQHGFARISRLKYKLEFLG